MGVTLKGYEELAEKYQVPLMDFFLIGLNLNGIDYKQKTSRGMTRGRFSMKPIGDDNEFFFAVTLTKESPYKLENGVVRLDHNAVGKVRSVQEDTCDDTYFRMGGKALTLNSNSRSNCKGCSFCGTYSLNPNDQNDLTKEEDLVRKIESIMKENYLSDMKSIDNIGIVTGCFDGEKEATDHVLMIKKAFSRYGFDGEVKYIGSQIQSEDSIMRLAEEGRFAIYLTVECFDRRKQLMRPTKSSLTLEKGREVLRIAKEKGLETTFLYILGLDSLENIREEFPKYSEVLTRHPIVNLMQEYVPSHAELRDPEAGSLEYYIKARKSIENVFKDTGLRPMLWENYRAPWSTNYDGEMLNGPKI